MRRTVVRIYGCCSPLLIEIHSEMLLLFSRTIEANTKSDPKSEDLVVQSVELYDIHLVKSCK